MTWIRRLVWRIVAQTGELRFHQQNRWRQTPAFMRQTESLFSWWGFDSHDYDGRVIVDLGAGSRLRSRYFQGARIVAVDPLADRFVSTIGWSDLREATEVDSVAAEEFLPHLEGAAAFVMCVNVLDHVFDPAAVVRNASRYLEPGGHVLIAVDLHDPGEAGHMHPVHVDADGLKGMLLAAGLVIDREFEGLEPVGTAAFGAGRAYTVVASRPEFEDAPGATQNHG